ncbi:MAG: hypothetical protein II456_07215 [Firmicutes bacterium]|nr:hypothetical protein [Bacillota bacterium]
MKAKKQDPKTVILPDDVKSYYRFSYDLTYEEAYAAFSALAFKRGGNYRLITGIALTAAAVIMLVTYAMDSTKIMNLILALTAVLLLFYLIYTPVLKAKKGARQVARANGVFKVEITDAGTISLPGQKPIPLDGDKDARTIETNELFIIRPDSGHTFCIPKRIMNEKEIYGVREILQAYIPMQDKRKAA